MRRDEVVEVSGRSQAVLAGTFVGPYVYRPDLLPEQPHSQRVVWQDDEARLSVHWAPLSRRPSDRDCPGFG